MKRNLLFLSVAIISFILGGMLIYFLNLSDRDDSNNDTAFEIYSNVKYECGEYYNKIWNNDNEHNVIDTECVPDKESAMQIANVIFNNMQKQGYFKEFKLQSVFYDKSDSVWIVGFWTPYDEKSETVVDGADFNIAISKKTGEILKMWVGE